MQEKIKKLVFSGLKLVVFTLWKLKLGYIISILFGMFIILFNKNEIIKGRQKTVILALDRKIFRDDVKALKEYPSNYKILTYPVLLRALISDEYMNLLPLWPEELKEQTSFYSKKEKYKDFYERLSKILYGILSFLTSFIQLEVRFILTSSFDYYQDYPWIKAIHNSHGKFIVLAKESIFYLPENERMVVSWYENYSFVYKGDAILFYNEMAKNAYIKSGAFKSCQSFVTGCPRVDTLVSLAKNRKKKGDFVLLACFMNPAYEAVDLWNEILEAVYQDELLRNKTIIKCRESEEVEIINRKFPGISAVCGSMQNYLNESIGIFVSFNSTSCLDALIAGIPVVVPAWGTAKKAGKEAVLGKHTTDVNLVALNKESLIEILKENITNNHKQNQNIWKNSKIRKSIEEKYSRLDGKNCQRFFDYMDIS